MLGILRRRNMKILGAAIAGLLFSGSVSAHAQDAISVRWGVNNPFIDANIPVNIGVETGIFAKHGLAVEIVQTQSPMPPLLAGSTDVTTGGAPPWLNAVNQGQKPRVVAAVLAKNSQVLMVKAGSELEKAASLGWPESIRALRGKTVGVSVAGAQVDLTTRYLMLQAGLDPDKDVNILAVGGGAPQVAALEQGRVDAIMAYVPFVQILLDRKVAVPLFDYTSQPAGTPPAIDQPYMLVTISPKFLTAEPGVTAKIRAALADVNAWMADEKNTAAFTGMLKGWFGNVEPQVIDAVVANMRKGGFRTDYACSDLEYGVDLMKSLKRLSAEVPCAEYIAP
jgi:NitT/TauT family transport system substrate-binding protein